MLVYPTYIEWETDFRATNPQHERAPSSDSELIRSIFERAIAFCGRAAYVAEVALQQLPKPKKKGKHRIDPNQEQRDTAEQTITAYKETEAGFWAKYGAWEGWNETNTRRAIRACPQKGFLWAQHCNQLVGDLSVFSSSKELSGYDKEQLDEVFTRALSLGTITRSTDIAEVFITRAASLGRNQGKTSRRHLLTADLPEAVLDLIQRGFEAIAQGTHSSARSTDVSVSKSGDSSLNLEKYLLDWVSHIKHVWLISG